MNNFCKNCGAKVNSQSQFCSECGKSLEDKSIDKKNTGTQSVSRDSKKGKSTGIKIILIFVSVILLFIIVMPMLFFLVVIGNSNSDNNSNSNSNISENETTITNQQDIGVTFSEQIIYDANDVIIKLTSAEEKSNGMQINLYIENNSTLNLNFNAHSYGVNGIMTRNNIYDMRCEVASGKKANTSLLIKNSILKKYGINYIKYIDVLFWAYDNDKLFKSFETNAIRIKSNKYDDNNSWILTGTEIYNKNGIKVDYLSKNGDTIKYVLTNNTGNNLNITFEGLSINDYTKSDMDLDLYNVQVLKDNQIVFEIKIDKDFKSKNSIDKISKVDFYLKYTINDDWNTNQTENITTIIN